LLIGELKIQCKTEKALMLTAVNHHTRQKIQAFKTSKEEGPFICPACQAQVILRKGAVRVHHFAHQATTTCRYQGESQLHLQTKFQVYDYIRETYKGRIKKVELEYFLPGVRPDVFIEGFNKKLAIEVQVSSIPAEELIARTFRYYQLGVYVLWVLPFKASRFLVPLAGSGRLEYAPVRLKTFERIIAAMYFKNLTLWDISNERSDTFILMKMEDCWTSESEFYSLDWSATMQFPPRKQKSLKRPGMVKYNVHLEDFKPSFARAFKMPGLSIALPKRKILSFP